MSLNRDRIEVLRLLQTKERPNFLSELIALALADLPSRFRSVRSARNREELRKEAHGLAGASAAIGASEVQRLAGELEARAEAGGEIGGAELRELETACREAELALTELLDREQSGGERTT